MVWMGFQSMGTHDDEDGEVLVGQDPQDRSLFGVSERPCQPVDASTVQSDLDTVLCQRRASGPPGANLISGRALQSGGSRGALVGAIEDKDQDAQPGGKNKNKK